MFSSVVVLRTSDWLRSRSAFFHEDRSHSFTLFSKHKANLQSLSNHNFVADVDFKKAAPGETAADANWIETARGRGGSMRVLGGTVPAIGNVPEGLVLTLEAEAEGSDVVVRAIQAQLRKLIAFHSCGGVKVEYEKCGASGVKQGERFSCEVLWQEPIILVAKSRLPATHSVRLKPGEAMVVPIQAESLVVGRSRLRALFRDVEPRLPVDPVARFLRRLDTRGYPAETNRRHFMLLSARILKEAEEPPKPTS